MTSSTESYPQVFSKDSVLQLEDSESFGGGVDESFAPFDFIVFFPSSLPRPLLHGICRPHPARVLPAVGIAVRLASADRKRRFR